MYTLKYTQVWGGICTDKKFAEALSVVEEVARQTRDDPLLRLISQRKKASVEKAAACSSGIALALRKRAELERAQADAQRQERRELERAAALQDAGAKRALEEAKAEAARERRETLETARSLRREDDARKAHQARLLEETKWLQADFLLALVERLSAWRRGLSPEQVTAFKARVGYLVERGRTAQSAVLPHLWTEDTRFTNAIGNVQGPDHSHHPARCSKNFEWILYRQNWAAGSPNDATWMLGRLFSRLIPDGISLFRARWTVQVLMHENQYVVEKAFVAGVFLASKWLRHEWLPDGLHSWPPTRPAGSASAPT